MNEELTTVVETAAEATTDLAAQVSNDIPVEQGSNALAYVLIGGTALSVVETVFLGTYFGSKAYKKFIKPKMDAKKAAKAAQQAEKTVEEPVNEAVAEGTEESK